MKASNKIDGLVEAVHYGPNGRLEYVRVYQKLGATFSDRVLLNREQLVEQLKNGKRFSHGQRKESWGFTFEPDLEIGLVSENNQEVIRTATGSGTGDDLKGIPLF